jgi:hypothetical protein
VITVVPTPTAILVASLATDKIVQGDVSTEDIKRLWRRAKICGG